MVKVNPRVDLAFKKIFGVEENKDLLISLINSIVSNEDQVKEITLLNPYNPKNFYGDRLSILDIKAKGHDGKRFNIEIQISDSADYDKRALYYWAKLYTEQLAEGDAYSDLSKAIGIHILNFLSIPESDKYHNIFHIKEKDNGIKYFDNLELHTIELNKFIEKAEKSEPGVEHILAKVKTALDLWAAFLMRHDLLTKKNLPKGLNGKSVERALNVLEHINFTPEEREVYEGQLKWLRDETSTLEKRFEKGRAAGREEGALETAKNLLDLGVPIEVIAQATGLSKKQIKNLE